MVSQEAKNRWAGVSCTLRVNGKTVDAIVSGRLENYAMIRSLDGSCSLQWAWETVDRIMRDGGQFRA